MANANKAKGDRREREAVAYLTETVPDLCVEGAMRMLGAGRKDDVGDLHVFPDVAIQVRVRAKAQIGFAIRSAAEDAVAQAVNGRMAYGVGMVPVPHAAAGSVKWLTSCLRWVGDLPDEPVVFGTIGRAVQWVRDDVGPHGYRARPRTDRVALLRTADCPDVYIAPAEAWLAAYRVARSEAHAA